MPELDVEDVEEVAQLSRVDGWVAPRASFSW